MDPTVLTGIAGSIVAALSAALGYVASRRRVGGEQTLADRAAFTEAQAQFRDDLRDEVGRLRDLVEALEVDVRRMRIIISLRDDEIEEYRQLLRANQIRTPPRRDVWRYPNDEAVQARRRQRPKAARQQLPLGEEPSDDPEAADELSLDT